MGSGDAILKPPAHIPYKLDVRFMFIMNKNKLAPPEIDFFFQYFHLAIIHVRISARFRVAMLLNLLHFLLTMSSNVTEPDSNGKWTVLI